MSTKILAATGALIVALGIAGQSDERERRAADHHYCQMVELWRVHQDRHPGTPTAGWPAHRSDIDCRRLGFSHAFNLSNQ